MTENKKKKSWSRRAFLIAGGVAGTGLVVGVAGMIHVNRKIKKYTGRGMGDGASLNAWVRIAPDNTITLAIPRAEMGQGVYTALPQLVAEELEVDMKSINVIHPQPESPYANTFMLTQKEPNFFKGYSLSEKMFAYLTIIGTGGSTSIPDGFNNMRYAGATAREMLKKAAAKRWNVNASDCTAKDGYIIHPNSGEQLTYGELAPEASTINLKELPKLKEKSEWTKIKKPVRRLDVPEKVVGKAILSVDVRPENLLYAAMRHPSVIGGKITGIVNQGEIENKPGVKKVVLTEFGAAVIADNTWRAKNAALALELQEEDNGYGSISSESIATQLNQILQDPPIVTHENEGDVGAVIQEGKGKLIEARYDVPYLAHATMEPLNCTVMVEEDKAEVWVGHQATSIVQTAVSDITGVKKSKITVNITYL